ncbi:MAG TPA: LysR family transcriptional regulator [Burkholderiaceae bacterium]|nr:LysR family transcriptional regulator [Burkholderiaceae bacterium]
MDRVTAMQLFVRAVESGSFSRAAADLNLTQPTVTKQVAALEAQLGARLLNRNTRGISPTEVGRLYYDKCKLILQQLEEAEHIAAQRQDHVHGTLRIGSSVAFGRRVVTPLALEFMKRHPQLRIDLSFVDTYVDLVAQGIDVAIRMGRLADSSLGARYLGTNPWVMVASPAYLKRHGTPRTPAELARHNVLFYSTVLGDDRLHFVTGNGQPVTVAANGSLRSNSLSAILAAVRAHMGVAALPCYVAGVSLAEGKVVPVLNDYSLPAQEIHAVFASPRQVPAKVTALIAYLQGCLEGEWWRRRL